MAKNTEFTEQITIGQFKYCLKYTGYDFELAYINHPIGNRRRIDSGLTFYGDESDLLVDDLSLNTNVFALINKALSIIAHRMASQQPDSFTLRANTDRKVAPYKRFARRLHRYLSHLYDFEMLENGAKFNYRKKPKSERNNWPLPPLQH